MLIVLLPMALVGAPPSNDNFANRIALTGTSISFTGNTYQATVEDSEFVFGSHSIWWSWTASETGPVILTLEMLSKGATLSPIQPRISAFGGTNNPNHTPNITGSGMVATRYFEEGAYYPSLSFQAIAGTNYYFQLADAWDGEYRLTLNATSAPIIFEQPRSITLTEHQCALFTVTCVGAGPLGYSWRFNGLDLQASNAPALGLTNVSLGRAGEYSVIISNSTGVCTSQVAQLYVVHAPAPPRLVSRVMTGSNTYLFQISGETGRCYRIERSADLLGWENATNFMLNPFENPNPAFTSVVFSSNGVVGLSLPAGDAKRFFRASVYTPPDELCMLNLKRLRFAKEWWGRDGAYSLHSVIQIVDLFKVLQIPDSEFRCPSGGSYFSALWADGVQLPVCSFPGHGIEQPR